MNVLVIGETGQLARALKKQGNGVCKTMTCLGRQVIDLCASEATITDNIQQYIQNHDVIIIAAAYTAVDAAEDDYDTAFAANALGPAIIAKIASQNKMPIVHISTDYVFSGTSNTPYETTTAIDPINAYGRSKAAGEKAVIRENPVSVILRTSWVYDGEGKNFLTTMLRLAERRDILSVVEDQIGRPTYARDLANTALKAAQVLLNTQTANAGIYHVSNSGEPISWAEFAKSIFEAADKTLKHKVSVKEIPTSEYPTKAKRPGYSVLDISHFEGKFDMKLPHWRDGLNRAMKEYQKATS